MGPGASSGERNGTMGAVQDQKGTIVVVDDEPNIADLVDLYLAREGFRVLKMGTGEAGLPAGKDHRPPPRGPAGRPPAPARARGGQRARAQSPNPGDFPPPPH